MRGLLAPVLAVMVTVIQVGFLSHLPTPFSDIHFPLLALTLAIFVDRPVIGAVWALFGGIVLDLHGIFPFGTEIFSLLGVFYLTRLLFRRFITNASLAAAFLFSTMIVAMHAAILLALDGLRVIFGADPFLVVAETGFTSVTLRMMLVHGLLTVGLLAGWKRVRDRFAHRFIIRT